MVVFDDLHWGEPTFLDLVEHVADLSRDAPILLLCMARPELLDVRPDVGRRQAECHDRVARAARAGRDGRARRRARRRASSEGLRSRILEAAGGNPLFVEEMVAMAAESGEEVAVPPTIQALLAARLDQLGAAERGVLERGAVEGQVFHRTAVVALARRRPGRRSSSSRSCARTSCGPSSRLLPDDDAYRFRHLLIRDTAYEALPKATRAELHERFADWLAVKGTRWSSSTRSSATTSNRRTAIARSSVRSTTGPRRSPSRPRCACSQVAIMRSSAVTGMR